MAKPETQTIEITNFGGRLTRILNGELNSGFAKFTTSYGYDPFTKPMNLTWMENPTDISTGVSDVILSGKVKWGGQGGSANNIVYAIGSAGKLYQITVNSPTNPQVNTASVIGSVLAGGATYNKGGSLDFFGATEKIYVGSDNAVNSVNFDGSADAMVGSGFYAASTYKPLRQFAGKLAFGNGPTIGVIDATGTVTSSVIGVSSAVGNIYSQLNPALGVDARVRDLDVTPDNNYLLITASNSDYENVGAASSPNLVETVTAESNVFYWNGQDVATTAANTLPANFVSALQTYLQNNYFFMADSFGAALSDGRNKILTLPNNKAPFPNATGVNGNFLFWVAPEVVTQSDGTRQIVAAFYYFGSLDQENPAGLYRLLRRSSDNAGLGGNIVQTPMNLLVSQKYTDLNGTQSSVVTVGYGQHYFSAADTKSGTVSKKLYVLTVPPAGNGTSQVGVYETQTQLFSKRIAIKQIRVYTEPTATGNEFRLFCIGSDGNVISDGNNGGNGFDYTYVAGTDATQLQGSLERINFNPVSMTTFALGLRIVNFGSVNMTIKKIEVDYDFSGK